MMSASNPVGFIPRSRNMAILSMWNLFGFYVEPSLVFTWNPIYSYGSIAMDTDGNNNKDILATLLCSDALREWLEYLLFLCGSSLHISMLIIGWM